MAGTNSLLQEIYTDGGGFDAERAAEALKHRLSIQRGRRAVVPQALYGRPHRTS
jgi:hypothetical protein